MTNIIKRVDYTLPHGHPCAAFAGSSTVDLQGLAVGFSDSRITTAAVSSADATNAMCQHRFNDSRLLYTALAYFTLVQVM